MVRRDYPGDGIVVHWDSRICMHSARCFGALPHVFQPSEQPWVQLGADRPEAVAAAIDLCPSGALSYTRTPAHVPSPATEETPQMTVEPSPVEPAPVQVTVFPDGPNVLVGPVEIRNAAGELIRSVARVSLCRCGNSENKPFCDGSHKRVGFTDPGPVPPVPPAQPTPSAQPAASAE